MKSRVTDAVLLLFLTACVSAPAPNGEATPSAVSVPPTPTAPAARPSDVASVESIIGSLYDVISGAANQARDWNRFRSLFASGARLIVAAPSPDGRVPSRSMTVEEYIVAADPFLQRDGFWEQEIARRVERYGNVAHVFSTYESRVRTADSSPFTRGINSIQLVTNGERWWVVTILWDFERPGNPIPAEYLPRGNQE